jgi:hypothetical protein
MLQEIFIIIPDFSIWLVEKITGFAKKFLAVIPSGS